ncbi:hypothetical protein HYALB_00010591 [Hymenoscyphus albidus]|uniref:Mitochondrial carrier n=1 Tax=Hymenoscyphus albidus TaxID=595503 RepID=A0A9N9QDZ3_9HELO|nr:hypothetical protein HYALB_00010591 [Hymenoscyphus albidus]
MSLTSIFNFFSPGTPGKNQDRSELELVDDGVPAGREPFADFKLGTAAVRSGNMAPKGIEETRPPYLHCMIAGGLGGTTGDLLMHSLDTVKTRQQGDPHMPPKYTTMASSYSTIFRQEGIRRGLYGGWLPALLGSFPGTIIFFGTYEYSKRNMIDYGINPQLAYLTSGFVADGAASFVYVPSEVLKTRLQLQGRYNNPFFQSGYNYKGFTHAARTIYRQEGFSALFYGYKATIFRDLPFSALQFTFYEQGQTWARQWKRSRDIGLPLELFTGAAAGGLAGVITCPLDVVKTRIQTQVNPPETASKPANMKMPANPPSNTGTVSSIQKQIRRISTSSPSTHTPRPGSINLDTSSVFTGLKVIRKTEGIAGWFRGVGPSQSYDNWEYGYFYDGYGKFAMPATLPVPSKGTLRTLRHLALGTTCTLALSAGLLTEDRRRRIHTAQVAHENSRKIKTVKNYHGIAVDLQDVANDPAIVFHGDSMMKKLTKETNQSLADEKDQDFTQGGLDLWREIEEKPAQDSKEALNMTSIVRKSAKERNQSLADLWLESEEQSTQDSDLKKVPHKGAKEVPNQAKIVHPQTMRNHLSTATVPELRRRRIVSFIANVTTIPKESGKVQALATSELQARQKRLASDVIKLLACVEDSTDLDAAVLRFLEAFEEGNLAIPDLGLVPQLLDAACQLSKACKYRENVEYLTRILDTLLPYSGSMSATQFLLLSPYTVIKHSLEDLPGHDQTDTRDTKIKLTKLSSVYLQVVNRNVTPADLDLAVSIGEWLCEETNQYGLYGLTVDVYHGITYYVTQGGRTTTAKARAHLIDANHHLGRHKRTFSIFKGFYSEVLPTSSNEFDMVISRVIDSTINMRRFDCAEYVLNAAIKIGQASGLSVGTSPACRVISHPWRSSRDFERSRQLFDRLLPLAHSFRTPQVLYQAIIQVCFDSGHADAAISYYTQLRKFYAPTPGDINIYGLFVYELARKGHWSEVEEDLIRLASAHPNSKEFGALFARILKLFVGSHSAQDTENFIGIFISRSLLKPSPIISNIIVDIYCRAKETDALCRWIELMASIQVPMDTVTTNTILHHCYTTWRFSYHETQAFYQRLSAYGTAEGQFTGKRNLDYLAQLAGADSPSPETYAKRVLPLSVLGRQKHTWDTLRVHSAISATHKKNDPHATLKIYAIARADHIAIWPRTLAMAAQACLQIQGHEKAMAMIKEAQDRGDDISYAISSCVTWHVMHSEDQSSDQLLDLAEVTIASLEKSGTRIDQGMLAGTMTMLVRRGKSQLAIGFWNKTSLRLKIPPSSIRISILTVLMHAYIMNLSEQGILWIRTLLEQTPIVPDRNFFNTLCRSINDIKLRSPDDVEMSSLLHHLNRLRLQVLLVRIKHLTEKERFKSSILSVVEGVTRVKIVRVKRGKLRFFSGVRERRRKTRALLKRRQLLRPPLSAKGPQAKNSQSIADSSTTESKNLASQEVQMPYKPRLLVPLFEKKHHRPFANDRSLTITSHTSYIGSGNKVLEDDIGSESDFDSQVESSSSVAAVVA